MGWLAVFRRSRRDRESAEELESYLDHETDLNMARGMSRDAARTAAYRKLGNPTRIREDMYGMFSLEWLENWRRDLRQAARSLARSRTFTSAAVLTLALGIGANTAVFSVVDALLLRPLPYPEPERLVHVAVAFRGSDGRHGWNMSHSGRAWEVLREGVNVADLVACKPGASGVNLSTQEGAEYVRQQRVGAGFFRILGVPPFLGREFTREEDVPGGPAVAVISHALWQRRFDADRGIVGRAILLKGEPHTVVGVMPENFHSSARADVWSPIRASARGEGGGTNYTIIGRLRNNVTPAQANAQIAQVGADLLTKAQSSGLRAQYEMLPLQDGLAESTRRPVLVLWGTVAVLLLICCVNLAGLLLARSSARSREIATRLALGGGRRHVFRQIIAESLLIALLGGLSGAVLGALAIAGLDGIARETYNLSQPVTLDYRVLGVTAGLALLTSLLFGLAPAIQASRADVRAGLTEGGSRSATASRQWPRKLLVAAEVCLGMVLLVVAGLLIRTFAHLNDLSPGYDAAGVLTASVSLDDARYSGAASVLRLYNATLQDLKHAPGVQFAAVGLSLPEERALNTAFRLPDSTLYRDQLLVCNVTYVTPEYFRALGIRLLGGRDFRDTDTAASQPVAVVNESFVRRYLSDREPLGRRIDGNTEIVGVVADVRQSSGWGNFAPVAPAPSFYIPASQVSGEHMKLYHTWFQPNWVVRSSAPPGATTAALREALSKADPLLPVSSFRTLEEVRAKTLARERVQALLISVAAGLALLLAAVGVYGLVAQSVVERTRELGIRLALGAAASRVLGGVVASGVAMAAAGVVAGILFARPASRILRSMIWGVQPGDPVTLACVAALLLLVAAAASGLPALKVLSLDPARVLRQD